MHLGRGVGLWLVFFFAIGCSSSNPLDGACIPGLSCKTHLEQVEDSAGCTSCGNCGSDWGSCAAGGLACKPDQLDLSQTSDSCETAAANVTATLVARTDPNQETIAFFSINQDRMDGPIVATTVAFDASDPSCFPAAVDQCSYTLRALQLSLPDFEIEPNAPLSWRDGTLTLTGPIAAVGELNRVDVSSANAVLAFEVVQNGQQRFAVASSTVSLSITFSDLAPGAMDLQLQASSFDFGGYHIDQIFFDGPIVAR